MALMAAELLSPSMCRHSTVEMAVGMAHGMSITARITPRPRKRVLTTSAMPNPIDSSSATEMTVYKMVLTTELTKSRSVAAST